MEDLVEILEIWMPVKEGGEAYHYEKKQNLKMIALIVNGQPLKLEKDFVFERRHITKAEAENKDLV